MTRRIVALILLLVALGIVLSATVGWVSYSTAGAATLFTVIAEIILRRGQKGLRTAPRE